MLLATPALAQNFGPQDFTSQTPYAVAPTANPPLTSLPAPPPLWTGFYLGLNTGMNFGSARTDYSYAFADPSLLSTFGSANPGRMTDHKTGAISGGQLGFNYQWNNWLIGAETDFQAISQSTNDSRIAAFANDWQSGIFTTATSGRLNWLGTTRPRFGVPFGSFLPYATAGVAYGGGGANTNFSAAATDAWGYPETWSWSGSGSATRIGWALGAGLEYALPNNFSIRAEYLHYDLGTFNYTVTSWTSAPDAFTTANARENLNGNLFRIGLNFRM